MTVRIDPARNEVRALRQAAALRGARVLEIGCGDGRLTRRLVGLGASVLAVDPDASSIARAQRSFPQTMKRHARFRVGSATSLPARDSSFDVVVFSWAL